MILRNDLLIDDWVIKVVVESEVLFADNKAVLGAVDCDVPEVKDLVVPVVIESGVAAIVGEWVVSVTMVAEEPLFGI